MRRGRIGRHAGARGNKWIWKLARLEGKKPWRSAVEVGKEKKGGVLTVMNSERRRKRRKSAEEQSGGWKKITVAGRVERKDRGRIAGRAEGVAGRVTENRVALSSLMNIQFCLVRPLAGSGRRRDSGCRSRDDYRDYSR